MDFSNPRQRAAFFAIHRDLPREGPGDRPSTLRALDLARPLPAEPRILDIGCGPGAQTLDLASALPEARILAIDAHPPYLEALRRRAEAAGVAGRVETRRGDMARIGLPAASFDLIWCEGAAYIMGLPAALTAWRRLLAPGGRLALSEPVWLRDDVPGEARAMFADYPAMGDLNSARSVFDQAGYARLGDFILPPEAWWTYYQPIAQRLGSLTASWPDEPDAAAIFAEARAEIACYRCNGDSFGYAFIVAAAS